ncbi:creatininase family protein [Acetohalobium arabaticum]|uniref:Creatininase n=1 Tax=Acetohalobium arabaticum (strain ATCC 49924 / DSM 5501 / Z-7288) TaxID=574087 RepID=D9QPN7_ACEAZ|nr:creatininase family protein [Acetohalobium arabaticum]ADL12478.1 Creatininase [Acetohalobium arabaticum DSM 5501]
MTEEAEKKESYWWQHKSWNEVVEHAKECDIAILPLGSIEQHGHHLPTGHDTLQLFPMLEKVAEETGAMLLPTPWYGAHPHHHWDFPGTIPLSNDTLDKLIKDVVKGASKAGFKKFILFFGHGQAFVTNYTVNDLGKEGYFVLSVMFQRMIRDVHDDIFETPFWHADEAETSIALAHFAEYVDMSKAVDMDATSLVDGDFVDGCTDYASSKPLRFDSGTVSAPEYKDLTNEDGELIGVVGKPSLATEEKGKEYTDYVVERTIKLVNHIKEKHPTGEDVETN